jgi:hypothetical protein
MEPLQEKVVEVLAQAEESKAQIAQTQEECVELINDKIVVQIVDILKEKTAQAQTQESELKETFQVITKEIEEAHKGYMAQDEPHVSVGGLLEVGQSRKVRHFWERKHAQGK